MSIIFQHLTYQYTLIIKNQKNMYSHKQIPYLYF